MDARVLSKIMVLSLAAITVAGSNVFAGPVKSQSFKLHFAERVSTPPVMDGKLDEECWVKADYISDYGPCTINQPQKRIIPRTEIRLLWDDKYLYVGAKCYEDTPENMASFRRIENDRKRAFHGRDCVEMHIDGNNDEHTTFQAWLLANHEKHINWNWDFGWGLLVDQNYGLNADWDSNFSEGKDANGEYWAVEARYALAHFELKSQAGYIFGFEPARFRYEKTLFKPDGSVLAERSGMWLGWGSQGKNHHNADGYGKVIFVEKKPATVAEGLKLAYPDLDQRTILVQTGSEYDVFDKGKVSTLTYEAKAKQLIAETDKVAARYNAFFKEASNVVWKASAAVIKNTAGELENFEAEKAKIAEMTEFGIAYIGDLEGKAGKWSSAFDTAYWTLVRDAMLIEKKTRVPVTLNPAADAPALGSEFADVTFKPEERKSDIVEWAKPLASGTKKVFITVNSQGGIDAWQLAKRMDINATIFQSTGQDGAVGVNGDYFNEGHWYTPRKRQELERALKEYGPFDGFVFIGTRIQTWPMELQCWLLERVLEGAKVVEKNGGGGPLFPAQSLVARPEVALGSPLGFTKLVSDGTHGDFGYKTVSANLITEIIKVANFGNGSVGRFSTDATGGYCHCAKGAPAWTTTPDNIFQDEYGFAYLIRNVMEVFGMRADRRAVDVCEGLKNVAAGTAITVPLRTAGSADWNGEIAWTVRKTDGSIVQQKNGTFNVPAGTNHVSLAVDSLEPGEYYVDAKLLDASKKIIDFASGRVVAAYTTPFVKCGCSPNCKEILPTPAITEFKLAAKTLPAMDTPVAATVKVAPIAAGMKVVAEIRDVRDRVVVREEFPVDAGTGVASIKLSNVPEYDWTLASLDVSLVGNGKVLEKKTEAFFRHRGNVNDYMVFSDNPGPGGYNGKMRLAYLQNNGIDLYQRDYSPNFLWFGGDAIFRDRIPGGSPDKGGSLTNPWWLKHLKGRYARHATALREVNGRWISLGDDSGEPHDFYGSIPDWVPCWIALQIEKCRKSSAQWKARGANRPMFEATSQWWREHGESKAGVDEIGSYWGFEAPLKNIALKFMASTTNEKDINEIVGCFREVYGTIEKFNRAANASITKWEDVNHDLLSTLKFDSSPEFVNFVFWLKAKYGNKIENLNAAWKTDLKDFMEIKRPLIDEKQMEGVYAPSIDMQTYLEDAFVGQCKAIADGIHGVDGTIGLGFGASTLGNTFCESTKYLDSVCPYLGSFDIELLRAQKHKYIGECIGIYGGRHVPVPMRRKQVWHGLLTGCNFSWFWASCFNYGDNSVDAGRYGAMMETYREIKRGPAALLLRSKRENFGIRVMMSRDSGHMGPLVADMSTHGQSASGFGGLVESLGLQYDSVTAEQVANNALVNEGAKVVLLPYLQIVNPAEAAKIKEFVNRGGTVIADARAGVYSKAGEPLETPVLDDLFGITRKQFAAKPALRDVKIEGLVDNPATLIGALVDTSIATNTATAYGTTAEGDVAFLVNNYGKGKAILLNFNMAVIPFLTGRNEIGGVRDALVKLMEIAGEKAPAVMKGADGKVITGTEFSRFTRGGEIYLGVEKTGHAYEKFPMEASVELDKEYWVYDVRNAKSLGLTSKIPMTLEGLDFELFSLLPAESKTMTLTVADTVKCGEALHVEAAIDGVADNATRIFRFELIPEGGYNPEEFITFPWRNKDAKAGKAATDWAIAFNDKPGTKLTVVVTDVATGISASKVITVK